jgi:hypothetical protein
MTVERRFVVAAAALAAVAAVVYAYDPATTPWLPSCPLRALTGLLCPLCGTLRAAHALLHGRVLDAVALNPFVFAAAAAAPLAPLRAIGAAAVLFAVVRNVT